MQIFLLNSSEHPVKSSDDAVIKGDRLFINDDPRGFILVPLSLSSGGGYAAIPADSNVAAAAAADVIPLKRPNETVSKASQHQHRSECKASSNKKSRPNEVAMTNFQEFDAVSDRGGKLFERLIQSILAYMKGHPQGAVFSENRLKNQQDKFTICEKPLRPKDIGRACTVLVDQGHLVHHDGKQNCWACV